jgi:hypothetical protein
VQDQGLVSKNVARISLAHNAPAGTLDKVAMEMNGAASALFTRGPSSTPSIWQSERQAKATCRSRHRAAAAEALPSTAGGRPGVSRPVTRRTSSLTSFIELS